MKLGIRRTAETTTTNFQERAYIHDVFHCPVTSTTLAASYRAKLKMMCLKQSTAQYIIMAKLLMLRPLRLDESEWPPGRTTLSDTGQKNQHSVSSWLKATYACFRSNTGRPTRVKNQADNAVSVTQSVTTGMYSLWVQRG